MAAKKPESPRKSPRQARARGTVDAILFAAAHILKTEGQARLSTNRIAALAGVSIGSVYQYFPNKQAIVESLRERHEAFYLEAVQNGIESATGAELRESLATMIRRMTDLHRSDIALHGELGSEAALTEERRADYVERLRAYLVEHAAELRAIPDPELTAYVITKSLEHLIHGIALEEPARLENAHYVDELVELAARYLGA